MQMQIQLQEAASQRVLPAGQLQRQISKISKKGNTMAKTGYPILLTVMIVGMITSGCGSAPVAPSAEVRQVLAPTGTLRVGVNPGTPGGMLRDPATGEVKGVAYELGKEFARRLGVPFEVVVLVGNAQFMAALKLGRVDFASNNATPARAEEMDFAQPHLETEAGFLVPPDSLVSTVADADRAGIRIGVTLGSTTEARFSKELKNAVLVRAPTIDSAITMLAARQMDAFATNKANLFEMSDKLPGFRVLEGRYAVEKISIAIPKGREAGMPFLRQFVDDAKSEGLVAGAVKRAGLRGTAKESK